MAIQGPDAMTPSLKLRDLDQTSTALWSAQMYKQSEGGHGKAAVRLPNTDERLPFEKRASDLEAVDAATESDQQSSCTSPLSSSSSSSSLEYHNPTVQSSSDNHGQDVNEPLRGLSPQGSRGHGDPRNEGIKAAKLRYQQKKLATQQAAEAVHKASEGVLQANMATSSESGSPPSRMDLFSSTSLACKAGPQPVVRLPQQPSFTPQRMGSNSSNPSSSFVSQHPLPSQRVNAVPNPWLSYGRSNDNTCRRSPPQQFHGQYPSNQAGKYPRSNHNDWTQWVELGVKIFDLPPVTTTRDLYKGFSQEGNAVFIQLYENPRGERDGTAVVRFSPPPARPFWEMKTFLISIAGYGNVPVRLNLDHRPRTFLHHSPFDPHEKYPESMVMHAESLDFGMMLDDTTMMRMCTTLPNFETDITFRQDMLHREITVEFPMRILDPRTNQGNLGGPNVGRHDRAECFRFCIPFSQTKTIHRNGMEGNNVVLLISLPKPPKFFKMIDKAQSHDDTAIFWKDRDAWYRQTDVVYDPNHLKKKALTLQKTKPIIDLGRWTTYRLVFDMSKNDPHQFTNMRQALSDYNVEILPFPGFRVALHNRPAVWQYLDRPRRTINGLDELAQDDMPRLAFEVRYQLEVCISHGYLNEYNLSRAFVNRLISMSVGQARDLLEYVANQGKPRFNPMALFQLTVGDGTLLRSKIPHYCVYIRSATVTPTTVHFQTPIAETSNRVIRQFAEHADRFLRVRFTDEKLEGAIHSTDKNTMNEVFTRVKRVLTNGILIGDRQYEYLASGNSQFREHGAYFFAPLPDLPTEKIRKWMGLFSEIETVPLYACRLGQCFSTTRAIHGAKATIVEISDIERNGFKFTDGVGRISPFLAHLAASELGIMHNSTETPSVFQIRLGGCKGILALSPSTAAREIHIRKSQYKFPAMHEGLEIIRWSQYACANLNRQLILILSALGVPDHVFIQKMRLQLSKLEQAMTDETIALSILQKDIDHNQMTLAVASMILDGFQRSEEPFMMSLLHLWRAWSIKYLKEKARITIGGGALLFGCVDETAILQGHFNDAPRPPMNASSEEKAKYVPQVFVQISKGSGNKPEVILGPMLLARNPSLHPGDVRVVCGVNVPELHHLKDVVVLPQTGDRDVAGMCSGGDLDGDDFIVIWDHDLLPREWNAEPMHYSRPPTLVHKNIGVDDLTTFFVTYMKNDTLARIANAHQAMADFLEEGVKDEKCLKLAALHSMAVDYVKTGQPAQMMGDLQPPKWPHFMNNEYRKANKTYTSRKVLGQLYDQVERIDFVPLFASPFDDRILGAYDLSANMLQSASDVKKEYDAHMRRIMAQHEIKTEFEVWSTFVLQQIKTTTAFKFHEVIGELSVALKEQFQALCRERAGGHDFEQLGPFVAAMYKVTSTEMASALRECQQFQNIGGQRRPSPEMTPEKMPLMSFPWLFPDVLGKIAKRNTTAIDGQLPVYRQAPSATEVTWQSLEAARATTDSTRSRRNRQALSLLDAEDNLQTAEGVTHRGEVLELFDKSDKLNDSKVGNDRKDSPSNGEDAMSSTLSAKASMTPSSPILVSSLERLSLRSSEHMDLGTLRTSSLADISMGLSGSNGDSLPASPSFSSEGSLGMTSLLDLEEESSMNRETPDYDGQDETGKLARDGSMLHGSNLRLLQKFMSDSESSSEGSGVSVGKPSHGNSEPSAPLYKGEGESVGPFEDDIRAEKQNIGKADKKEEEEEKNEGNDGHAEYSDGDVEEVEICFDRKSGLLDPLASIGEDGPQAALHIAESNATDLPSFHGSKSKSESMPGSPIQESTLTKGTRTSPEHIASEAYVSAPTSPGRNSRAYASAPTSLRLNSAQTCVSETTSNKTTSN